MWTKVKWYLIYPGFPLGVFDTIPKYVHIYFFNLILIYRCFIYIFMYIGVYLHFYVGVHIYIFFWGGDLVAFPLSHSLSLCIYIYTETFLEMQCFCYIMFNPLCSYTCDGIARDPHRLSDFLRGCQRMSRESWRFPGKRKEEKQT